MTRATGPQAGWFWVLGLVTAALFAAYLAISLSLALQRPELHRFGDFVAFWTSAKIAYAGDAGVNYDAAMLHARQVALGLDPADYYPFPFPPYFLLLLTPLGALNYTAAFAAFMGVTLAAYLWAIGWDRLRAAPWLALALVLPTTAINLIAGQTGFLSGALAVGALRLMQARPVAAGVCVGLLSFKPQLGLLMPVALIAARRWQTLGAAIITVIIAAAISALAFGAEIWPLWWASLADYSQRFGEHSPALRLMPTVLANARMFGVSPLGAEALQLVAGFICALLVWRAFRAGATPRAGMILLVATFLATPHALVYDLTLMGAAIIWFLDERLSQGEAPTLVETAALVFALIAPIFMRIAGAVAPLSALALIGLLAVIMRAPLRQLPAPA